MHASNLIVSLVKSCKRYVYTYLRIPNHFAKNAFKKYSMSWYIYILPEVIILFTDATNNRGKKKIIT